MTLSEHRNVVIDYYNHAAGSCEEVKKIIELIKLSRLGWFGMLAPTTPREQKFANMQEADGTSFAHKTLDDIQPALFQLDNSM